MLNPYKDENLLKLSPVLKRVAVSKSAWYAGIREGRYPKPVKLGPRAVAWKESDISALIASLSKA